MTPPAAAEVLSPESPGLSPPYHQSSVPLEARLSWGYPGHGDALPICGHWTYSVHLLSTAAGSGGHYRGWRYKCGRFECPKCDGWIKREARAVAERIARAVAFGAWVRSDSGVADEDAPDWSPDGSWADGWSRSEENWGALDDYTPGSLFWAMRDGPVCVACAGRWRPGQGPIRCPHISPERRLEWLAEEAEKRRLFEETLWWRWVEQAPADRVHLPIHVVLSPPLDLWGKIGTVGGYEWLKHRAYAVAKSRGIRGGCVIFHHTRLRSSRWEYNHGRFSEEELDCQSPGPHFHVIGLGWVSHISEGYRRDGWVVKNLGARKSVYLTALYQLSHASRGTPVSGYPAVHRPTGAPLPTPRGPEVVTWFGELSYGKRWLKEDASGDGTPCLVCDEEGAVRIPASEWYHATPTFVPHWEGSGPPEPSDESAESDEVHGECRPGEWRITIRDATGAGWGGGITEHQCLVGSGGGVATYRDADLEYRISQATAWLRATGRDSEADDLEHSMRSAVSAAHDAIGHREREEPAR